MADFPHMDWYCRDYIADTRHLTPEQKGAYTDLLNYAWLNKAQLVDNDAELARMCGFTLRRWIDKIRPAMERFWTIENGIWFQERQQKEFHTCSEKVSKNRANAALGGKAKALNANTSRLANASQTLEPKAANTEADSDSKKESVPSLKVSKETIDPPQSGSKRKRGSSWPDDFELTPDMTKYARDHTPNVDAKADFERFRCNAQAKGLKYVDWLMAWYTWCRSPYGKPMNGQGPHQQPQKKRPQIADMLAAAEDIPTSGNPESDRSH